MNRTLLGVSLIMLGGTALVTGGLLLAREPEAVAAMDVPTAAPSTAAESVDAPPASAPASVAAHEASLHPEALRTPSVNARVASTHVASTREANTHAADARATETPARIAGPPCIDPRSMAAQAAVPAYARTFRVCPGDAGASESVAWVQLRADTWSMQAGTRAPVSFRFVEKQAMVLDPPAPRAEVMGSVVTDGRTEYFIPDRAAGGQSPLLLVRQVAASGQPATGGASWRRVGTMFERR